MTVKMMNTNCKKRSKVFKIDRMHFSLFLTHDDNNGNGVVLLILLIYCQPRTAQGHEYQQDPGVAVHFIITYVINNGLN